MTRNVLTVERDQSLKSAAEIMSDRGDHGNASCYRQQ
ncbi:MAG: hypothetical protein AB1552_05825 [Nitrospirota bacterium]